MIFLHLVILCTYYGISDFDVRPRITKVLYDKKDFAHKRRFRHHTVRPRLKNSRLLPERTSLSDHADSQFAFQNSNSACVASSGTSLAI